MRTIHVPECCFGISSITRKPVLVDVFLILDDTGLPLWHENLFLIDQAKEFGINTCRAYANDLLSFARMHMPMGGWMAVSESVFNGYVAGDLIQARKFSEASVVRHTITVKKFYEWLYLKGYLNAEIGFNWNFKKHFVEKRDDLDAADTTAHSHHSTYITPASFKLLCKQVTSSNSFISTRDRVCLKLGYLCGTRATETLRINAHRLLKAATKCKDENSGIWATTTYMIIGKGNKRRNLEIPPSLCRDISNFVQRFPQVFSNPRCTLICREDGGRLHNYKHASYAYTKAQQAAALPRIGHQGYHALRKSFGTNLVNQCHKLGVDPWVVVPRRMGHENVETTYGYIFFEALLNGRSHLLTELRMMTHKGLGHARAT
ncbi:MAG: tyrosine-type recombinase/integrase [Gammaproteobacteria bacterium]|nr:tyrosine-type recombinase/integrase [Gammaproteobacteria bacterium]MBU0885414.1 tyrosine-type recombinase/integrase [Gammaproteobacteria bacterium]